MRATRCCRVRPCHTLRPAPWLPSRRQFRVLLPAPFLVDGLRDAATSHASVSHPLPSPPPQLVGATCPCFNSTASACPHWLIHFSQEARQCRDSLWCAMCFWCLGVDLLRAAALRFAHVALSFGCEHVAICRPSALRCLGLRAAAYRSRCRWSVRLRSCWHLRLLRFAGVRVDQQRRRCGLRVLLLCFYASPGQGLWAWCCSMPPRALCVYGSSACAAGCGRSRPSLRSYLQPCSVLGYSCAKPPAAHPW